MRIFLVMIGLVGAVFSFAGPPAAAAPAVDFIVPAFSGDIDKARGASFVLKLELQAALREYDETPACADSKRGPSSLGEAVWIPGQLESPSADEARRLAILDGAQAVLWGKVSSYNGGVLVSPYLTMVNSTTDLRTPRLEEQAMTTAVGRFEVTHPGATIQFEPIPVDDKTLKQYSFAGLRICDPSGRCRALGSDYHLMTLKAVRKGGAIDVSYEKKPYRLTAPALLQRNDAAIQFAASMAALLRAQTNAAYCGFHRLGLRADAPLNLRVRAFYYAGLTRLGENRCPIDEFLQAAQLMPTSLPVARALLISRHAEIWRGAIPSATSPDKALKLEQAAAQLLQFVADESGDPRMKQLSQLPL